MKRQLGLLIIPLALALGACGGGSSNTTAGNGPASTSGGAPSSGGVSISTKSLPDLGTILVNGQGITLYVFAPDKAQKVTCSATCQKVWPPLKISGGQKPSVSGGVKASLISSVPDPTGGRVVTYNGWPLYTYVADPTPGTAHGQALNSTGGLWYVISPSGQVIKKKTAGTGTGTGYCLSANTRIATPNGSVRVDRVKPGAVVWSTDGRGRRIRVKVLRVHHVHVPASHVMVRLRLADGRHVLVSLRHPLPSGKPVETLVPGQRFEGSRVVSAARVRYGRPYTYDLLPAGPTHTYFADGVLLGSTLVPAAAVDHP